jgi:hypothetical protein
MKAACGRISVLPTLEGALAGHERMIYCADAGMSGRSRVNAERVLKWQFVVQYVPATLRLLGTR